MFQHRFLTSTFGDYEPLVEKRLKNNWMKPLTLLDAILRIQMIEFIIWLLACAFITNGIALTIAAVIQVAKGRDDNSWKYLVSAFLSIAAAIVLSLQYQSL